MNLSKTDPRYQSALACVDVIIAEQKRTSVLEPSQYQYLTQDKLWMREDRALITQCIHAVVNATLEVALLPRFSLPAEFIAAAICLFVSPCNWRIACSMLEGSDWASRLADGDEEVERIRPDVLFAMVVCIYADVASIVDTAEAEVRSRLAIRSTKETEENLKDA